MQMLLRDITVAELSCMLNRHADCSSAPHLIDSAAKQRARKTAKQNGVWDQIDRDLDPAREIPVIKRSVFRTYSRTGERGRHLEAEGWRAKQLELATMALWLDHPKADLDYLQDILWAYCDDWTWVMNAHEGCANDLGSITLGARLAEILHAMEGRLEQEVADRVHAEIEKRIFQKITDYKNTEFWHTARMNWNHVCNGGVIRAALLEIKDSTRLARLIHSPIQNMTYALDGFTDDGGCEEGAGYWGYGFGHYVQAAYALNCRTGGELNIMAHEKVEKIARFPLAANIHGMHRALFADSGPGAVAVQNALQINYFYKLPELYELCVRRDSGKVEGAGALQVRDMHSLALYRGQNAKCRVDQTDCYLPDLGMVKMRGRSGRAQMTVVAIAGHNGVPHNHNDIGSYIVFKQGRMVLTDPGAPLYNKQTFSDKRYEILWCRSRGHSVPIINGMEQKAGRVYCGKLSVEGLNEGNKKRATIDMTSAYPRGTVRSLVRNLELDSATNGLFIEDAYSFSKKPKSIEEAFVTFEKAVVIRQGKAVRIGSVREGVVLSAGQAGRFLVMTVNEKPEHTKPGMPDLQRITFEPAKLVNQICLKFVLK